MNTHVLTSTLVSQDPMDRALRNALEVLGPRLKGELRLDMLHRRLYSQDASVYQDAPIGVVFPKDVDDLREIVRFAAEFEVPLIPRAAGTSLAGQCVGEGLVVDVGRHMNQILELDVEGRWVRVQPGVILDDLNRFLAPHGLFFGPDTSTASRCMIGGMAGNNSCGTHSILYGTTRDHVLEMEVVFADAVVERIGPWTHDELAARREVDDVLGVGLRELDRILTERADLIRESYPRPEVARRNTGYAFDETLDMAPYTGGGDPFTLTRLLCGSEGTLGLTSELKLNLVDRPKFKNVVAVHFDSLRDALEATVAAVEHEVAAVELMDRRILDLAKGNIEQERNRFFVEGDPDAILVVEFYGATREQIEAANAALIEDFVEKGLGYAHPIVDPPDDKRVWALRKAGLGILMGVPGDVKPVTVVEDTAVAVQVLPEYIDEFAEIMERHDTACVYYAHASVGELHLRPELNIKEPGDVEKFKAIAVEVTDLVKKFGGSISGEHGDGRLRAPMLEQFFGKEIADEHVAFKRAFDPGGLFNPGKIVDAEPIDVDWRVKPGEKTPYVDTVFDWSADMGLVRAVEKCNGAGACRKRAEAGGTMCPSYMATLDEKDSTRGRANVFRQVLMENEDPRTAMADEDLYDAMDLCVSCKGCKSECPASVDMARMKAEFLQNYHDAHGLPLGSRLMGHYGKMSRFAAWVPWLANFMLSFFLTKWLMGWFMKLAPERQLPAYAKKTFRKGWAKHTTPADASERPVVGLYVDPFTEYTEPELAWATVRVLEAHGWKVDLVPIEEDGRTYISKGMLREARAELGKGIREAAKWMALNPDAKVVGVEPSALLTFRDEAPDLVEPSLKEAAIKLGERSMLLDEFIMEVGAAPGANDPFADAKDRGEVVLHGHCHQKAIVGTGPTVKALEKAGYTVEVLNTGCCGMAGSFGYERDHYGLSMKIGELVLFPALREREGANVVAPGTSCRHQIKDGTGREAKHTAVWLDEALG